MESRNNQRVKSCCDEESCLGKHQNFLLQANLVAARSNPKTSLVYSSSQTTGKASWLDIAPVRFVPGLAKSTTFVDNSSDTNMVSEKFAQKHQPSMTPTSFLVCKGVGRQVMAAGCSSFCWTTAGKWRQRPTGQWEPHNQLMWFF